MGFWKSPRMGIDDETLEVTADVEITAPRQVVWDLIKPAENAPLFDPQVTKAFRGEGTPTSTGEIQVFIYNQDGRESIGALEVIDEVPGEYAITRSIGREGITPLVGNFLSNTPTGTRLEQRYKFVLPPDKQWVVRPDLKPYVSHMNVYLQRAKALAENRGNPGSAGLQAWKNL